MKITKFNYPSVHRHYFKVVLDGKLCQTSTDVSVTYSLFEKLAEKVDFKHEFHDLVHIQVFGDCEAILQSINIVGL